MPSIFLFILLSHSIHSLTCLPGTRFDVAGWFANGPLPSVFWLLENDYIYLIALLLHLLLDLLFYVWSHWLICSSIKERLNYIFLSILTWLINILLNPYERYHWNTIYRIWIHVFVFTRAIYCMISCAPDHTHPHGLALRHLANKWKPLILNTHLKRRKCKRQRLSNEYLRTTALYHSTDCTWIEKRKCARTHADHTQTQIIKMKTNKQPF